MKHTYKAFIAITFFWWIALEATAQGHEEFTFPEATFPQEHCLALNIYFEARSSNLADKYAVADVVLNRVRDTRFPTTICEVVKEGLYDSNGHPRRNKCQFSWWCDGKKDHPNNEDRWVEAQTIAWSIIKWDKYRGLTEGATHYHATYVRPAWRKDRGMQLIGRIGAHIFYRWE